MVLTIILIHLQKNLTVIIFSENVLQQATQTVFKSHLLISGFNLHCVDIHTQVKVTNFNLKLDKMSNIVAVFISFHICENEWCRFLYMHPEFTLSLLFVSWKL